MKTRFRFCLLICLFAFAAGRCFALQGNEEISKERAKELGVTLRSNPNGEAGVKVWMEFKTTGELKNFTRVELQISEGGKQLMSGPLLVSRPDAENVSAYFSADPAWLTGSVLTIVVTDGPRSRVGYQFKVKDFIELPATGKKAADATIPTYETAAQVKAMPACKATMERRDEYSAQFKTADGRTLVLGSGRGDQWVWHFLGTLKAGQTCALPEAFNDFHDRKVYVTADEIRKMPAGKATLKLAGPCFSNFQSTDGKWFTIGDPGAGEDVWGFLATLKEGQTCDFPGAFGDYLKKKKP